MDLLPTLPRRTWLERISITLACALVLVAAISAVGWWFHHDALIQPLPGRAPIRPNSVLCFLLLGLVLLALEFGGRRLAWLTLLPAAIGATTLDEYRAEFQRLSATPEQVRHAVGLLAPLLKRELDVLAAASIVAGDAARALLTIDSVRAGDLMRVQNWLATITHAHAQLIAAALPAEGED